MKSNKSISRKTILREIDSFHLTNFLAWIFFKFYGPLCFYKENICILYLHRYSTTKTKKESPGSSPTTPKEDPRKKKSQTPPKHSTVSQNLTKR